MEKESRICPACSCVEGWCGCEPICEECCENELLYSPVCI